MRITPTTNRVSVHRNFKRLVSAIEALLEAGILAKRDADELIKRSRQVYAHWREERKRIRQKSERGRGRPKSTVHREEIKACKKLGCNRPPAAGQAYCSIAHAPYGLYDVEVTEVSKHDESEGA